MSLPERRPQQPAYNPFDDVATRDPFTQWAHLRNESPVFFSPMLGWWIVTRYEDLEAVIGDPERFSSEMRFPQNEQVPDELVADLPAGINDPGLLLRDPPMHTRLRKLTSQAFRPQEIAKMESTVRSAAEALLEEIRNDGQANLLATLAVPLPYIVIARILGLEREDASQLNVWTDNLVQLTTSQLDQTRLVESWRLAIDFHRFLEELVSRRRVEEGEGFINTLINAKEGMEQALTDREIVALLKDLTVAGHETTRHLIANLFYLLLAHPEQADAVRANPTVLEGAVEEALRFWGPGKGLFRRATQDVILGGANIQQGDVLQIMFASANRDEQVFSNPDHFDVTRTEAKSHLAFGRGIHYCIGAPLARMEARIALQEAFDKLPNLRLVNDQPPNLVRSLGIIGMTDLSVKWDVRTENDATGSERESALRGTS